MKIAFIGDSFCAQPFFNSHRDQYRPYPYLIAQEYNADVIAIGRSNGCLYHSYEDLLEVVDKADYTVLCITDPFRLVNRYKLGLNFRSVEQYMITGMDASWSNESNISKYFTSLEDKEQFLPKKLFDNIYNAANNYFEFLCYDNFHGFVQLRILEQLDMLMLQMASDAKLKNLHPRVRKAARLKKKCIWFPCFENSMREYVPKSGPIADTELIKISNAELKNLHPRVRVEGSPRDPRPNHLSKENNQNMANLIIDIIERDAFDAHEIKMEDYFEVLK